MFNSDIWIQIIRNAFQIIAVLNIISSSGDRAIWEKHINGKSIEILKGQLVPGDSETF
jgi:hypothetical protein